MAPPELDEPEAIARRIQADAHAEHPWAAAVYTSVIDALLRRLERELALPSGSLVVSTDADSVARAHAAGAPAVVEQGVIHVADTAPAPTGADGLELIAHEAVHVAQYSAPQVCDQTCVGFAVRPFGPGASMRGRGAAAPRLALHPS